MYLAEATIDVVERCAEIRRIRPDVDFKRCVNVVGQMCYSPDATQNYCRVEVARPVVDHGQGGPDAIDQLVTGTGEVLKDAAFGAAIAAGTVLAAGVVAFAVAAATAPEIIIVILP